MIKEAEEEDLETIALLSFNAFKGLFISDLGIDFLKDFYKAILLSENGIIYVWKDNEVKGFICGIIEFKNIFNLSFKVKLIYYLLRQILALNYLNIIRFIKRNIYFKDICKAELISIVVREDCRRQGIGKMLIEKFCSFLFRKGIRRFKVITTDPKVSPGSFLYEKLNFTLLKTIDLFGIEYRCYEKLIEEDYIR